MSEPKRDPVLAALANLRTHPPNHERAQRTLAKCQRTIAAFKKPTRTPKYAAIRIRESFFSR